ncbi:MAG: FxLYD domain-containing protein [Anaerolineae bacterium]
MKRKSNYVVSFLTFAIIIPLFFCVLIGIVAGGVYFTYSMLPDSSGNNAARVRLMHLPTLTPTPSAVEFQKPGQPAVAASAATPSAGITPNVTPSTAPASVQPSSSANQPPTVSGNTEPANSGAIGWSFVGVPPSVNEGQTVVRGVLINNTGSPQQNVEISAVFYNAQGQELRDQVNMSSHVPIDVIPIGAHVPFELKVNSNQAIARLKLSAQAQPAAETLRQDFRFADINQWMDQDGMYCLGGQIQNTGASLQDYMVILATIYNNQGKLVSFSDDKPSSIEVLNGGKASPFEMCLDPMDQQVARYELTALGY